MTVKTPPLTSSSTKCRLLFRLWPSVKTGICRLINLRSQFPCNIDLNEIWYVCTGRSVKHNVIYGQGYGHGGLKCAKMARYACNQKTNGELWYLQDKFILVRHHMISNLMCSTFDKQILPLTTSLPAVLCRIYLLIADFTVKYLIYVKYLIGLQSLYGTWPCM